MPVSYRIDTTQKIIYTTFEGEITDQQMVRHARKLGSEPEVDSSFVELIHAGTSSMKGVTGSGIRAVAGALRVATAISKIGIVTSKDIEFGLARMVEALADKSAIEIQVFREQAEARSWLGIE